MQSSQKDNRCLPNIVSEAQRWKHDDLSMAGDYVNHVQCLADKANFMYNRNTLRCDFLYSLYDQEEQLQQVKPVSVYIQYEHLTILTL